MQVEDLKVYHKLCRIALQVHELTMTFPKYEMYEIGSQLRRSSNSAPANLAEGFGNKHTNIYTEAISRAQGEIRETKHHLYISYQKKYLTKDRFESMLYELQECSKMLYCLEKSLNLKKKR